MATGSTFNAVVNVNGKVGAGETFSPGDAQMSSWSLEGLSFSNSPPLDEWHQVDLCGSSCEDVATHGESDLGEGIRRLHNCEQGWSDGCPDQPPPSGFAEDSTLWELCPHSCPASMHPAHPLDPPAPPPAPPPVPQPQPEPELEPDTQQPEPEPEPEGGAQELEPEASMATASTIVHAIDGVPGMTTYRLVITLGAPAASIHTIFGDSEHNMGIPAAWQAGPFVSVDPMTGENQTMAGVNIGGTDRRLDVENPYLQFDSCKSTT